MIHLGICESKGKLTNKLSLLEDSLRLIFVSPDRVMAFEKQNLVGVEDLVQWYNVCLASVRLWVSSGEREWGGWGRKKSQASFIIVNFQDWNRGLSLENTVIIVP